ncbi:MAG: hypothetical protein EOS21_14350 [Mesorhizobium sp.]|nr:MAG: hypothetical protein EOS21_14350 [Mesorhizobium sp.]
MNIAPSSYPRTRKRLMAAAASVAIAGAIGFGAVATVTAPVLAEAVRVEAPQVPSFADVVERVSPAVVSVRVKAKIESTADDGSDLPDGFGNLPDDPQLRRFFREFRGFGDQGGQDGMRRFGRRDQDRQPRPVAQGSGFFISDDGYLVTNNHVVGDGSSFTVVMHDGKELDAKLVGTDPRTDLAVLKVEGDGKFTYVDFADDSKVRVGDWVVAVGNPFGLGGTVTAGNASGVNDGAAALIVASEAAVKKYGLTPIARILGGAAAGVAPRIMGIGPVPATQKLCARLGLKPTDFDVIELNEAFASQGIAVLRQLGVAEDAEHVNPNGGAIALGHPLGMSGARISGTAALELRERGGRYALATMCIGVGQGIAVALEGL